ncbi:MAG: GNVR domain-containing protein [Bacteroidota bacterium]
MNNRNPDALDGIEIQSFLTKIKQRWKLYLLVAGLALLVTFVYHLHAIPRYLVVSTLLQQTETNPSVLTEAEDFAWQNIWNEVEILKSTQVMRRAIQHAHLQTEVFEKGWLFAKPVGAEAPISMTTDLLDSQASFDYQVNFRMEDASTMYVEYSELPSLASDQSYELPLTVTSQSLKMQIEAGDSAERTKTYTLRIKDPLTRALEITETLQVDLTRTESTMIKVELESSAPTWAIRFIEQLIHDYQSLKVEHKNESILSSLAFINEQLALIKDKLNQIEYELVRFRERNETIDINAEGSAVLTTLLDLENELAAKKLQMNYYTQFLDQMNSSDSNQVFVNPSAVGITDRVFNEAVTSLNSMILDLNQLRTSSTEINPRYLALERSIGHQIELLKSSISDYRTTTVLSLSQLEDRIKDQEREIRRLPSTQKNLISLQREFDMNETMYLFLEERRAEAEISKASNISQVQVIDSPYVFSKVFPRELLNYLIALLVAVFGTYFGTSISDLSAQKIDSARELADRSSLPVIGVVHERKTKSRLPSADLPASETTESFRRMTSHLRRLTTGKKFLQVCSPTDEEGRTYVAVNLATMLARYRHKVVLVDANLRAPRVTSFVPCKSTGTLTSYLEGRKAMDDIVSSTEIANLDVIGGEPSTHDMGLLHTPQLTELWQWLKVKYDYVVIDSAPLTHYTDALDLMELADYAIFVASKFSTPISSLRVLDELPLDDPSHQIGVIFNEQRQPVS